jgi:hypothetical protein
LTECVELPLQDNEVRVHVVKWALPREGIPVSITWGPRVSFNKIKIELPEDLQFVEFLNTKSKRVRKNIATIEPIHSTIPEATGYAAMILRSTEVYNDLISVRRFLITFLENKEAGKVVEAIARVFRPILEIVEYPRVIDILDSDNVSLPLHLKYKGFGNIQVRFETKIAGEIVSYGDSIIFEILKRLWITRTELSSKSPEREEKRKKIVIDEAYIERTTENLKKMIREGSIPREVLDEQALDDIKRWFAETQRRSKQEDIIKTSVGDLLVDILIDVLARNPAENVKLVNARTNIETRIEAPVTHLELSIHYRDLMMNDYEPIIVSIQLQDKRKERKDVAIRIPLKVEKWTEEPFMNVENMSVEEGKHIG